MSGRLTRLSRMGMPRKNAQTLEQDAAPSLVDRVRDGLVDREVARPTPGDIAGVVGSLDDINGAGVEQVRTLAREFSGLGELAVPLCDPQVTDVLINGPGPVWVDRGDGVEPTHLSIGDAQTCRRIAVRLAASCGVRLDDSRPFADGILTDLPPGVVAGGVRVHAVLDPPASSGACVSLRALSRGHGDLAALQRTGMFSAEVAGQLRDLVAARRSFLVSGGTGAGKTTLLAAMLHEVPASERLLLVEDTPELVPDHPHVVGLRTRDASADGSGEVDMRTLVRQSLRMRPDRIVVGEIRGAEIAELLLAFNTGHGGSAGTVHANSLAAVPGRLTALGALAGMPAETVARQVGDGVDTVVHLSRVAGRRQVCQIGRLSGDDGQLRVDILWDRTW
ncbi:TadA family conjugal transfer-associated ATPase [Corynebacterium sp. AOP40-9SA-29]|uniref:TadA family conjugal transfer-associated ATPase n=1 Tax=Corynebacterium sp. AOP40-9SA-29 TaxID=3457677 RepID=UPI0040346402